MADAESEPASPDGTAGPNREQLDKLRHDLAAFVRCEVQVVADARAPRLRRAGVDLLKGLVAAVALGTAVVLVNVAILLALALVLPAWAAALILAGVWLAVAAVTGAVVWGRAAPVIAARRGDAGPSAQELRTARDAAWRAVQEDLALLAPPVADRVAELVAPLAARVAMQMAADAAEGAVGEVVDEAESIGREVAHESEEIVEELADEVPGASVASTVWDLALLPGRTGVRMVTTVLKRPSSGESADRRHRPPS